MTYSKDLQSSITRASFLKWYGESGNSNGNIFLDFMLVQKASACLAKDSLDQIWKGQVTSPEACANACRGTSQMFLYGTNEFGGTGCAENVGCECHCSLQTENYRCRKTVKNLRLNLYAFKEGGER